MLMRQLSQGQRHLKDAPMSDIVNLWKKIVFPLNWDNNHWIFLVLVPQERTISIYDSHSSHTGESGYAEIVKVCTAYCIAGAALTVRKEDDRGS